MITLKTKHGSLILLSLVFLLSLTFTAAATTSSKTQTLLSSTGIVSDSITDLRCLGDTQATETEFTYIPENRSYQCVGYHLAGRYASGDAITASYQLASHKAIKVSFKLATIDKWEDNSFSVAADGVAVYTKEFNYQDSDRASLCGEDCSNDHIEAVKIGFNHTDSALNLSFTSTLDQDVSVHSWGICDLTVELLQCSVYSNGDCLQDILTDSIEVFGCSSSADSFFSDHWSYLPTKSNFQCGGNTFVGRLGALDRLQGVYTIPTDHESIFISFKLAVLEAWRDSSIRIAADGDLVFNQVFNRNEGDGAIYGYGYGDQSLCGTTWPDSIETDYVVEFNHSSQSLSLIIDAATDAFGNENWGICGLKISVNRCPLGTFDNGLTCSEECPAGTYPSKERRNCLPCTDEVCPSSHTYTDIGCISSNGSFDSDTLSTWEIEGSGNHLNVGHDTGSGYTYLGKFGQGVILKKTLYSLPQHTSLTISFKAMAFNSWNNGSLIVKADGVKVSETNFASSDFTEDLDAIECYKDAPARNVSVSFSHTGRQITLEFASDLDEMSRNEGWGICGLEIVFSNTPESESPGDEGETSEAPQTGSETETEAPPTESETETWAPWPESETETPATESEFPPWESETLPPWESETLPPWESETLPSETETPQTESETPQTETETVTPPMESETETMLPPTESETEITTPPTESETETAIPPTESETETETTIPPTESENPTESETETTAPPTESETETTTPPTESETETTAPPTESENPTESETETTTPSTESETETTTPSTESENPAESETEATTPPTESENPTESESETTTPPTESENPTESETETTTPPTESETETTTPPTESENPTEGETETTTPPTESENPTESETETTTPPTESENPTESETETTTPPTETETESENPTESETETSTPPTESENPTESETETTNPPIESETETTTPPTESENPTESEIPTESETETTTPPTESENPTKSETETTTPPTESENPAESETETTTPPTETETEFENPTETETTTPPTESENPTESETEPTNPPTESETETTIPPTESENPTESETETTTPPTESENPTESETETTTPPTESENPAESETETTTPPTESETETTTPPTESETETTTPPTETETESENPTESETETTTPPTESETETTTPPTKSENPTESETETTTPPTESENPMESETETTTPPTETETESENPTESETETATPPTESENPTESETETIPPVETETESENPTESETETTTPPTESENPTESETETTTPPTESENPTESETETTTPPTETESENPTESETETTTPPTESENPTESETETTITPTETETKSENPTESETETTTPATESETETTTPSTETETESDPTESETETITPPTESENPTESETETTTLPTETETESENPTESETETTTPPTEAETETETETETEAETETTTPPTESETPTEAETETTTPPTNNTEPNPPSTTGNSYWFWYYSFTFEWLVVIKSVAIEIIHGVRWIEVNDEGNHNTYGNSVGSSMITAYAFTFTDSHTWACVGFVESANGISALPLDSEYRTQSMVICSDNTFYGGIVQAKPTTIAPGKTFTISVDLVSRKFEIREVGGNHGLFTGTFTNANWLYYTIQFKDQGTISFDPTVQRAVPTTENFDWVYLNGHENIQVDSAVAQVRAVSDKYVNLFGEDFNLNANCGFEFQFKEVGQWACVGFIEVAPGTIDSMPLSQDIRDHSHVLCYDGTQFMTSPSLSLTAGTPASNESTWTVEVDSTGDSQEGTITFTSDSGVVYSAVFSRANELHSTLQFALNGVIQFTPTMVDPDIGCPQITQTGTVLVGSTNQDAVYSNEYYDLSWISGLSSSEVTANPATGQVQCTGTGTHNMIGQTFTEVRVTSFTFTMLYSMSWTCMGFVEKSNVNLLDINQDLRAQSISVCSDGSLNGLTKLAGSGGVQSAGAAIGVSFSVSVNVQEQSLVFRQIGGDSIYVGYYESEENLHYSAQYNAAGAIQFGSEIGHLGDNPLTTSPPPSSVVPLTMSGLEPAGYNFDFSWLNPHDDPSLIFDSAYAKVVNSNEEVITNIGETFNEALIAGFDFTLVGGESGAPCCVGFIDEGANNKVISLCSDGTTNGVTPVTTAAIHRGSEFLVSVDPNANTVTFKQIGGKGEFSASYTNEDNLRYLVSFGGSGAVAFGPSLRYARTM